MSFEIVLDLPESWKKQLDSINDLYRYKALDSACRAFAKPVVAKMKAEAPSSRRSGTRAKWGKKETFIKPPSESMFNPSQWAKDDSGKNISFRISKRSRSALLFIGPAWPKGNKLQFNDPRDDDGNPTSKKHILWGKDTGRTWRVGYRWQQKAYDESAPTAIAAWAAKLKQEIEGAKLG